MFSPLITSVKFANCKRRPAKLQAVWLFLPITSNIATNLSARRLYTDECFPLGALIIFGTFASTAPSLETAGLLAQQSLKTPQFPACGKRSDPRHPHAPNRNIKVKTIVNGVWFILAKIPVYSGTPQIRSA